ncbi:MON2 [Branchiostoma lanceolatum]|uniref:Protein MON2 homolog n=1 Tax=Branchiostoma lanceolatum TaxID=7740 RepID=A0A8K0ES93_BRALA|nr:MON2 [Branchiostoma lanceolatum]
MVQSMMGDLGKKLVDGLLADLRNLSAEAKKKYPVVRQAAEGSVLKIRTISAKEEDTAAAISEANLEVLQPLVLGCDSRCPKLVQISLTSIQRLVSHRAVSESGAEQIVAVLWGLMEVGMEELKVLQTILVLITMSGNLHHDPLAKTILMLITMSGNLHHNSLAKAIVVCFRLHFSKDSSVANTAAATVQQVVSVVFERLVVEDGDEDPNTVNSEVKDKTTSSPRPGKKPPVSLGPCAADAYLLFQDLCQLVNADSPYWLVGMTEMTRTFGLELVENILTQFSPVFFRHPEFSFLLKERVCPLVIKLFSPNIKFQQSAAAPSAATTAEKPYFPISMRLLRLVYALISNYYTLLMTECEIFLSLLVKFLDADKPSWQRVLAVEVLHKICVQPNMLRCFCQSYDMKQHSTKVFRDLNAAVGSYIQTLFLLAPSSSAGSGGGSQSGSQGTSSDSTPPAVLGGLPVSGGTTPPPAFEYRGMWIPLLFHASAGVAKPTFLEMLDKTDPLAVPEEYSLSLRSLSLFLPPSLEMLDKTDPLAVPEDLEMLDKTDPLAVPEEYSLSLRSLSLFLPPSLEMLDKTDPPAIPEDLEMLDKTDPLAIPEGLEMLDKTDPPAIPEGYGLTVAFACLLDCVRSISTIISSILPPQPGGRMQKNGKSRSKRVVIPSSPLQLDTAVILYTLLFVLCVTPADQQLCETLATSSWTSVLAALSLLLDSSMDESATQSILLAIQTFASICGQLGLNVPRDAFVTTLCKACLPPHYALTILNTPGLAAVSKERGLTRMSSKDASSQHVHNSALGDQVVAVGTSLPTTSSSSSAQVMLTVKNIQCMRSLLDMAHCHGPILGTAWHLVLTTLQVSVLNPKLYPDPDLNPDLTPDPSPYCWTWRTVTGRSWGPPGISSLQRYRSHLVWVLGLKPAAGGSLKASTTDAPNAVLTTTVLTDLPVLSNMLSRLFESSQYLDEVAIHHLIDALSKLSQESMGAALANREPSLFPVAKLLETGLVNLNRAEILWRPVTAHLLEVSQHSHGQLRDWGAEAITQLVKAALAHDYEPPLKDNKKLQGLLLTPLQELCQSSHVYKLQGLLLTPLQELCQSSHVDKLQGLLLMPLQELCQSSHVDKLQGLLLTPLQELCQSSHVDKLQGLLLTPLQELCQSSHVDKLQGLLLTPLQELCQSSHVDKLQGLLLTPLQELCQSSHVDKLQGLLLTPLQELCQSSHVDKLQGLLLTPLQELCQSSHVDKLQGLLLTPLQELCQSSHVYKLQGLLLTPLQELCQSSHVDVRQKQLDCVLQVLQNNGDNLGHAWPVILEVLGAATDQGPGVGQVKGQSRLGHRSGQGSRDTQNIGDNLGHALPVILEVLGAATDQGEALIRTAFQSLQLVVTDFLPAMPSVCLQVCITVATRFGLQKRELNISLTSIGLLWNISDFLYQNKEKIRVDLEQDYEQPSTTTGEKSLLGPSDSLWMCLYSRLADLCVDSRPAVRKSACQTLFSTIQAHGTQLEATTWETVLWQVRDIIPPVTLTLTQPPGKPCCGSHLGNCAVAGERHYPTCNPNPNPATWETVLWQVLFPLLDRVKAATGQVEKEEDKLSSSNTNILIHHSRDTAEKQWAETRVLTLAGVARVFCHRRHALAQLDGYPRAWALLLEHVESAALSPSSEVSVAALHSFQELLVGDRTSLGNGTSVGDRTSAGDQTSVGDQVSDGVSNSDGQEQALQGDADDQDRLWSNAWRVWYGIGTSCTVLPRPGEAPVVPSQQFLATLVQIFPPLFNHISHRFVASDLDKFAKVVQTAVSVPVHADASPFLIPLGGLDSNLSPLQDSVLRAVEGLQKAISVGPELMQAMYPAVFDLLLTFVQYSCQPPKYGSLETRSTNGPDRNSQVKLPGKVQWVTLNYSPFSEKSLVVVVDLYKKTACHKVVIQDSVLEKIIKVVRLPLGLKYACPSSSMWKLAAQSLLQVLEVGLPVARQPTNAPAFSAMWTQLGLALDDFLFSKHPAPPTLSVEQHQKDEAIDVQMVELMRQDILPHADNIPTEFTRKIISLLNKGSIHSTTFGIPEGDMLVRLRENFSRVCFQTLLEYSLAKGENSADGGITKLALTAFLQRAQDVLVKYTQDERLSGKLPLPRHRMTEVTFVLRAVTTLLTSLKVTAADRVDAEVWTQAIQLFPALVECVTSTSPQLSEALRETLHLYADLLAAPQRPPGAGAGTPARGPEPKE